MKKEPRLKFTDQELVENTPVGAAARKAQKAAKQADKADAKIPRRKKPKVALHFDDEVKRPQEVKGPREKARGRKKAQTENEFANVTPKTAAKKVCLTLHFEEQQKSPEKFSTHARDAPRNAVRELVQGQNEDDNVGVEAAQTAEKAEHRAETTFRELHRSVQMRP